MLGFDPTRPGATLAECEAAIARCHRVREIVAVDLAARLARGEALALVDLRTRAEQAVSTIAGALLVDEAIGVGGLEGLLHDSGRFGRPMVVYCAVGLRSARLVESLPPAWGASNLRGGIFRWFVDGHPLAGARRAVHPFDARWGRLLDRQG